MAGRAQAHLVEADDGNFYVVKFANNPERRRILVNELISSCLLQYLRISAPSIALIETTDEFLENNLETFNQSGIQRARMPRGCHFGSQYPGDPSRVAVYDFLPDALLLRVFNLADFRGAFVFDTWVANSDNRQAVFVRSCSSNQERGFVALLIDNGNAFNGPNWDYDVESLTRRPYGRALACNTVHSLNDFQPWLDDIMHLPETLLDDAFAIVPPEWLDGDEKSFRKLLEELLRRRKVIPSLLMRGL